MKGRLGVVIAGLAATGAILHARKCLRRRSASCHKDPNSCCSKNLQGAHSSPELEEEKAAGYKTCLTFYVNGL